MWTSAVFWLPAPRGWAEDLECELGQGSGVAGVRPALDNETLTLLHSFCFHHHYH